MSGQDGAYLSRLLLDKNYAVHGTSRDAHHDFARLRILGIRDRVVTHTLATTDTDAMRELVAHVRPDEIYNLSGLSSVALSFEDSDSAWSSVAGTQLRLLEIVRAVAPKARLYHSASSDCFGDTAAGSASDERTPFAPCSPYAAAKAAAHQATLEYRKAYGLYACSGIVFNHESPLRAETFVTRKIVAAAIAIAGGQTLRLRLGDLSASRDWGYAAEYVDAMWRMLQPAEPDDYVIATGESHTVEELAAAAFAELDLDHRDHIDIDPSLIRRAEIRYNRGDATRARKDLGWKAHTKFRSLVRLLVDAHRVSDGSVREAPAAADIAAQPLAD